MANSSKPSTQSWTKESIRSVLTSTGFADPTYQQLIQAATSDVDLGAMIAEVGAELGAFDARDVLNIEDHFVDKPAKFDLRWPLPPEFGANFPFQALDRKTQFSILFATWSRREYEVGAAINAGTLDVADAIAQECVLRAEQLEVPELFARSYEARMKVADMQGDHCTARSWSHKARAARGGGDALDKAEVAFICREAEFEVNDGHFAKADALLTGIVERLAASPESLPKLMLAQCLQDRGQLRRHTNRPKESLADAVEACRLCESLPPISAQRVRLPGLWLQVMLRANPLYVTTTYDTELALALAEQLIREAGTGWAWLADSVRQELAHRARDWQGSIRHGTPLLAFLDQSGFRMGATSMRSRLAEAYLELGELGNAIELALSAEKHLTQFGPPDVRAYNRDVTARILSARGDHDGAWHYAAGALADAESLIRGFRDLALQQRFVQTQLERFASAFDIAHSSLVAASAFETGQRSLMRAWSAAERAKAFYLRQIIAAGLPAFLAGISRDEAVILDAIEEEIDRIERESAGSGAPEDQAGRMAVAYEGRRQLLERALSGHHLAQANMFQGASVDLARELARLGDDVLVLAYYWHRGSRDYNTVPYVFWSKAGKARLTPLVLSEELQTECAKLRQRLRGPVEPDTSLASPTLTDALLPTELWQAAAGARLILVSPSAHVQMVPLHAFVNSQGKRLIDLAPVQYVPTLALLGQQKPPSGRIETVGLLACPKDGFNGPPLTEFAAGLSEIEEIWKSAAPATRVVARSIAPDQTLPEVDMPLRRWEEFDLLQISCHGRAPEDQPLNAGLYLGKECVRTAELFATKLKAQLICLSACQLGRHANSEGDAEFVTDEWAGMCLPLLTSGSGALLVSLWDACVRTTNIFMRALHTALASGAEPATAYAMACRSMTRREALWANWYLVGLPESASLD